MSVLAVILQMFLAFAIPATWNIPEPPPTAADVGLELARTEPPVPHKIRPESIGVDVTARSAIVADAASGTMLFSKAPDDVHAIASLTKLVTALVVMEDGLDFDQIVTISSADQRGGSVEHFIPGEKITIKDLWHASLVGSSNTATVVLARSTGFSDDEFVERMNEKAKALGMDSAQFVEPTGLDERNRASAADVVLLARAAFAMDDIQQALIQTEYEVVPINPKNKKKRIVRSTDQLLGTFLSKDPYTIRGGKTGSLGDAIGYHLALAVSYERTNQIYVVVLASKTRSARFRDAKALSVWAFDTYSWERPLVVAD